MATRPTALITGASSGIGLAVSTKISQGGWSVVLVGRSQERLDAAHAELRLAGAPIERIHCVASDIGRTGEAGRCVRETMARHGRIDAVVNNAGTGRIVPIPDTTDDLLHDTFAPNVFGPAMLIAHAWNRLRSAAAETGRATIVNVSSLASIDPFPGFFVLRKFLRDNQSSLAVIAQHGGIKRGELDLCPLPLRFIPPDYFRLRGSACRAGHRQRQQARRDDRGQACRRRGRTCRSGN